jgi:uncharacterized protein DUF6894
MTSGHCPAVLQMRPAWGLVYRRGEQGPMRYYFNLVRARETISDQVGIELADASAQFLEAIVLKSLAELRKREGKAENRWKGWMLEVRDAANNIVLMIDLGALDGLTMLAIALGAPDLLSILQDFLGFD